MSPAPSARPTPDTPIRGRPQHAPGTIFYVAVDDVGAALDRAEQLGGRRVFGPATAPSGLVIGHVEDPEGDRIGLAALPA